MPRKGMRSLFSSHSNSTSPSISSNSSPIHYTFSQSIMDENVEIAKAMIEKWNPDAPTISKATYLFSDDRKEAKEFLKCVNDLQKAMHFFVTDQFSSSEKLINAQNLMQMAMKRLEKEFYQILSSNRDNLDPETISGRSSHVSDMSTRTSISDFEDETGGSEDEIQVVGDSISEVENVSTITMSDLRSISDCMIASGYGKECVKIYKIIRKSIVDEGLYRLGIDRMNSHQIQKLDWDVLDFKIKNWANAVRVAVKTLFTGERILCDFVFSTSDSIRETCFSEITREAAINLFTFAEIVAKGKKSPEKMFRILDLYDSISELWPQIDSIFSFESTSIVRSQAVSSLVKLGEAARSILTEFESAIQKDFSKSPVPGGGIHPLTRYVMNYVCFLSDYSGILSDILADWPLPVQAPLPDCFYDSPSSDDIPTSAISVRFAWLVLVLLCKLDGKTEFFKDVSLSYLFLANNLHYVVSKVTSSNLRFLLGEDWISRHEMKVKQYSANYERMAWTKVINSLPQNTTTDVISRDKVKEYFHGFNSAFEAAYRTQSTWIVSDGKLREEIKVSLCKKIGAVYRVFYDRYRVTLIGQRNIESLIRFSPDDIGNYLSDLFYGTTVSGSSLRGSVSR